LTANTKAEEEINKEAVQLVRELIGPVAAFRLVAAVNALPRTRSGKMARKSISDLARAKKVIVSFSMFHQKKRRLNVFFSVTDPAHHRGSYGLR
jgi:AMP-binding enzyme C-terminal domain